MRRNRASLMAIDGPHGTAMAIDELRWDLSTVTVSKNRSWTSELDLNLYSKMDTVKSALKTYSVCVFHGGKENKLMQVDDLNLLFGKHAS